MKSETATYSGFEFEVLGYPALAIINKDLATFEERYQYQHSVFIDIIPDTYNEYGHPTEDEYDYLNDVEKKIIAFLESETETIHVGHVTTYRKREIIFYTKKPESVENFLDSFMPGIERESNAEIEEDPEWESVSAFYEQFQDNQDQTEE